MVCNKEADPQQRFLPIDLAHQVMPGTFEYALNDWLDNELDLSDCDARLYNHATGASAYRPAMQVSPIRPAAGAPPTHGAESPARRVGACRSGE